MKPEWRIKEEAAEAVNRLPAVNGIWTWKCEKCGKEWNEPEDNTYDRTQDRSNWPVFCLDCWDFLKEMVGQEDGIK